MSTYSNNHHLRAPQQAVLVQMEAWLRSEPNVLEVERVTLAEADALKRTIYAWDDPVMSAWAVAPTETGLGRVALARVRV